MAKKQKGNMGEKRGRYDMQQRSPAGMEPETLTLCGMYNNHSANKDTLSYLTDFKECFFIRISSHGREFQTHREIQVLYLNFKLKTEVFFFLHKNRLTHFVSVNLKKMPYVLQ